MKETSGTSSHKAFSEKLKTYILLHFLIFLYSVGAIFSKLASTKPFLSLEFLLYYGVLLVILVIYALGWKQVLNHLPLSVAFVNKSVVVIWVFIWGALIFKETITPAMLVGSLLVVGGICLVVTDHE